MIYYVITNVFYSLLYTNSSTGINSVGEHARVFCTVHCEINELAMTHTYFSLSSLTFCNKLKMHYLCISYSATRLVRRTTHMNKHKDIESVWKIRDQISRVGISYPMLFEYLIKVHDMKDTRNEEQTLLWKTFLEKQPHDFPY